MENSNSESKDDEQSQVNPPIRMLIFQAIPLLIPVSICLCASLVATIIVICNPTKENLSKGWELAEQLALLGGGAITTHGLTSVANRMG